MKKIQKAYTGRAVRQPTETDTEFKIRHEYHTPFKGPQKASLGALIGIGADNILKKSETARNFTKNLGLAGNILGSYYDNKTDTEDKTTGAEETTQVVAKRKGGKVKKPKKFIYGGVANPAIDQTQAYSSFAPQAPMMGADMSAPAMDAGMSDPMSGYKDGGSVNIGKGKDYIKDLL
jgi:hypothetical protein